MGDTLSAYLAAINAAVNANVPPPLDPGDPAAALDVAWVGAVTDTALTVAAKTTSYANVRIRVSTSAGMTSPASSTQVHVTDTEDMWAKHTVTGLAANTPYYWAVEINNVAGTVQGPVATFPTAGIAANVSFVFGSCVYGYGNIASSNHLVFDNIVAHNPDVFCHLGDFHYQEVDSSDFKLHNDQRERVLRLSARQQALYRKVPTVYMFDNHDYAGPFGSENAANANTPSLLASYRNMVPHYTTPTSGATDPVGHAFTLARCRIIILDPYSQSSLIGATDNGSKTKLGTAQKTWLKAQVVAAQADSTVGVIFVSIAEPFGLAKWSPFTTETNELATYFNAQNVTKLIYLCGDVHALGADDGTNTPGGYPMLLAAAFENQSTSAEGTWSEGAYGNPDPTREYGQFGLVTVTDNGTTVTVDYDGRRVSSIGVETSVVTLQVVI